MYDKHMLKKILKETNKKEKCTYRKMITRIKVVNTPDIYKCA